MRRALRENGVTAVSIAAISSAMVLLGRVVTATLTLSLETELMALSLAWVSLYRLQRVLVGKRRCSGHWLVQYGAMAAYYLPAPLAFYAANAVCSSTSHIAESTPFLVFGVGRMFRFSVPVQMGVLLVTNMRAYSLRDNPRHRYNFIMWLVFLGCVDWEWARRISSSDWPGRMELVGHIGLYFSMLLIILFDNTSESTLDCQTKAVADYMKRQESSKSSSTTSSPFFDDDDDANSNSSLQLLDCCRYPFVQGENGEWVTLKDLFHHQCGDLPVPATRDKEVCLSYSLCRLLARRYYGFHCAEEGDDKVRRFALADLGTGYKRAFKTVEVQLAFLHDYFFTSSLTIIELGYTDAAQPSTFDLFVGTMLTFLQANLERSNIFEPDMIYVLVIVLLGMLMSLFDTLCGWLHLPVQEILAIYWRPIHTAFRKLNCLPNARSTTNGPNRPDARDVFDGVYWRNKIGQYSILEDYDRRRSLKKAVVAWFQGIILSQPSYKLIKHLPVKEEDVDMQKLDNMRELVADTLRAIDGPPSNGTRSLKINMDSTYCDWSWTCKQETHTDTILIWHIATCYCDMITPKSDDPLVKWHHEAARALSRYCAYLVAFLPEFLPEHILTTKQVFQRVMQEAQEALGTTPTEEKEKHTKMRELLLPPQREQQTTFQKGVQLGRQLEMLDDTHMRWKVMADFWAETILYVAPSDNAEAHIEHLAKGGEFITHLWAMLSNAGILKRAEGEWQPPAVTATEGQRTQQLTGAMSSSNEPSASLSNEATPSPPTQASETPTNGKEKQPLDDPHQ